MTRSINTLQNYKPNLLSSVIWLVSSLLLAIAISLLASNDVSAISRNGPDENDFSKSTGISNAESTAENMMFVVDDTGAQIGASVVSLYLPVGPSSWAITINEAETCGTHDAGSATTTFILETYTPVDGADFTGFARTSTGCTGPATITMTITAATVTASSGGGAPITFAGGQSFYRIKLRTTMSLNSGASNGFEVVAPTGGYVSYYAQSGNRFAVQDRAPEPDSQWRYTDYSLKFAPSCNITTSTTVRVNWYDDDWGTSASLAIQRNFNTGERYRMQIIETNRASGAVANTWYINTGAPPGNAQSWNFPDTTGFTGNQTTGYAEFNVRPNYRYELRWLHVRKANAVQFQLPFDSMYWLFACETNDPPTIAAAATCTAITGTARDPDGLTTVQAGVQLGTGGAIQTLSDTGVNGAFSITIPNSLKSGFQPTIVEWVRVDDIGPGSGGFVYDTTPFGTTTDNLVNLGTCGTMWDYYPQRPTGPADSATGPKPGSALAIQGAVINQGDGTGRAYTHRIQVGYSSTGPWSEPGGLTSAQGGIGAGATRTLTLNYTVPANRPHGSQVCFLTSATPVTGQTTPTSTITNSGTRFSTPLCYTIYNLRFNMENPVIGPGPSTRFVSPGDSVAPTISVENSGNGPTPPAASANRVRVEYSSNVHAPGSPNLSATSTPAPIPAGGDHSFNGSGTIPSSAVVGSQYCVSARALPQQGYSDGTGTSGVTATTQYCYVVTNSPYLKVYGNDSWAGFDFSNATSCAPGRGLVSSVNGSPTNVGASDEYAVFGMGNIDSFGTANSPLSHLMKFANTPTHGNYGANRCVADYFDLLDDAAVNLPTGVNSLNGQGGGQYIVNGNISTRTLNGLNNYNNQHTVLVDGDLIINGNVVYTNSYARDDVPILIFVVRGNIFINENVRQLDGIYIAIDGIIETCSTDSTIGDFDPVGAPANGSGVCDEPLEVNGSFIAQNIYFKRTGGGINEASTGNNVSQRCSQGVLEGGGNDERCAAEIFRFSPEAYLARPYFDIGQPESTLEILQLRDLPPVF